MISKFTHARGFRSYYLKKCVFFAFCSLIKMAENGTKFKFSKKTASIIYETDKETQTTQVFGEYIFLFLKII
jgi:hypothetical protein